METQEKFLLGALIGGAIGATAALMLTPVSGYSLRRKIRQGLGSAEIATETAPKTYRKKPRERDAQSAPKRAIPRRKVHLEE